MGAIKQDGEYYSVDFRDIESMDELFDVMNKVYAHMGGRLEGFGISPDDVISLLDGFMNAGKNFGATYQRLIEEGKVPANMRLTASDEVKDMEI